MCPVCRLVPDVLDAVPIVPDGVVGVSDGVPEVPGQVFVGVFGVLGASAVPTLLGLLWLHGVPRMPGRLGVLQVLAI